MLRADEKHLVMACKRNHFQLKLSDMVNVLIVQVSGDSSELTRMTALNWLYRFLELHSVDLLQYLASYLTAILPFLNIPQLKGEHFFQNCRLQKSKSSLEHFKFEWMQLLQN